MLDLSIAFYQERTCFLDISYHLFYILKDNSFAIQNNRFGAFFTQLFPLIGSKLGLSLKIIAILYSTSFVLLPMFTFFLIHIGLKNSKISLSYLLFIILMTTHTFYWIQSELPQAFAFLFMLIALLDNHVIKNSQAINPTFWLLISVLTFTVCFTHPLIIFPFTFFILYYLLTYKSQRKLIIPVGLLYFSFYLIKALFFKTPYDNQAMGRINNFITLFPNYLSLESNKILLKYFINDYYILLVVLLFLLIVYVNGHYIRKLALLLIFFLGYCLIVNVSYPTGADQFYIENQYMILSFFIAIPLVLDVLPKIKYRLGQILLICLICAIGLIRIVDASQIYQDRLTWNRNLILNSKDFPNKKLIIAPNTIPIDTLLMTWGTSYEIWLLSTIEQGFSRSIIIEEREGEFDWALPNSNSFITKWGYFYYTDLNKKYFIFNDTSDYIKME